MKILLLLLVVGLVGQRKAWPVPDESVEPATSSSADVTSTEPYVSLESPSPTETSIEGSSTATISHKNVTKNPVKQLVKDLFTLYDAVSDFVKPWFGETTTKNPDSGRSRDVTETTTEPAFDDFEDTNNDYEDESRKSEDAAFELFSRYVRSAENINITSIHKLANSMLHEIRKKRDVTGPADMFYILLNMFVSQGRRLWNENESNARRYVRDMWSNNGQSLMNQAWDVMEGRGNAMDLVFTIGRHIRDVSDKIAGKDNVEKLIRHVRQVQEGRQNIFQGYYDFIINEYSYKFWAVYMLAASALLTYSAIAAIYYAKFNTSAIDYELYDDFARSNSQSSNPLGLVGSLVSVNTYKRIMEAISSRKYS